MSLTHHGPAPAGAVKLKLAYETVFNLPWACNLRPLLRVLKMPSHVQDGSVSASDVCQQVDRILQSGEFSGSEVLRNLLSFLTRHSIDKPGKVVKEYELAVGVLGKPGEFDPRQDSAVRVHTARLRAKLAEYYMSHGAEDPILIEVPKGSYHILWRHRDLGPAPQPTHPNQPAAWAKSVSWRWFATGFASAVVLVLAAIGVWTSVRPGKAPAAVEAFWQPFLQSPQPPIIVFSIHRFAGSAATGLHYFREGIDSPAESNDTYSGTGTVMAIGELSSLFSMFGRSPRLKGAELLTWDEARDANVIFVGAPEANSRLREMAPLQYFAFKSSFEEPRFGTGGIVNLHPAQGEETTYFGSSRPFTFDYFVVALLPNLRPGRRVLVLAGTNTYGCQAAAEFLTRADLIQDLSVRLGSPKDRRFPDFEALLKVGISGGVPIQPHILAVRLHQAGSSPR